MFSVPFLVFLATLVMIYAGVCWIERQASKDIENLKLRREE